MNGRLPMFEELRASSEYPIRHRVEGVKGAVRQAAGPREQALVLLDNGVRGRPRWHTVIQAVRA